MATGFLYHEDFLKHDTGRQHPERPARLLAITDALEHGCADMVHIAPTLPDPCWLLTAHSQAYLHRLETACREGLPYLDTPDCAISSHSWNAALLAVGAGLAAVDAVMSDQVQRAFCAVRPPGHHAEYDAGMGFCLLNNVVIATHYLRRTYGVERVLIFDWDVHHGNGTQHAFESDPDVLFCSIHQDPRTLYPGTGYAEEIGQERGRNRTINLPMPAGSTDDDYQRVLEEKFLPAAQAFRPQFIFVSVGFDPHVDDPLAGVALTDAGFAWMGRMIRDVSEQFCQGRLISILEGGYNLEVLQRCVPEHLAILQGH